MSARRLALSAWVLVVACGGAPDPEGCDRLDPPPDVPSSPGACAADGECGTGALCGLAEAGVDDGDAPLRCRDASEDDRGRACEGPDDCARGLCVVAGTCVAPCRNHAACPAGSRCRSVTLRRGIMSETLRGRACVPELVLPGDRATPEPREVPLPALPLDASPLSLVLSECAAPAAPLLLAPRGDAPAYFAAGLAGPANPLEGTLDRGLTVLLPSGDPGPVGPATLTLEGEGERRVVGLSLGSAEELDLDLYYVGTELRPEGERGPPEIAAALEEVEALLGLRVAGLRQHRVGGAAGARLGVLDFERPPGGGFVEIPELARLGSAPRGPAVPVFLVRLLEPSFLGLTGGVPGPLGAPGSDAAWLILSVDVLGDDLGPVLAHELGHYLGLFHPVERDGFVNEAFADTPTCPAARDVDGNGLTPDECADLGGDNLMFPLLTERLAVPPLSPSQQAQVRRTATLVGP